MTVQSDLETSVSRILIVDDDQTYVSLCERYLKKGARYQYEILTASGAAEAIHTCSEKPFDCLLIDFGLPDRTGTDLIGTLRERLGNALPPFIIISADATAHPAIQAVRADAADFLSKREVTANALRRSVDNAVEKGMLLRSVDSRRRELQRANTELERRAVEIQRFYHTVSHEMKTPLTAAREFVAIVRDGLSGPLCEDQETMLDHALDCCDQITTQFNDLIDLTRLETGKMRLEPAPTDFEPIVSRAVAMCATQAKEKEVTLQTECEAGLPLLQIDGGRITQVLSNLLNNAVKFTPPGGQITLATARFDAHSISVSVTDTGCGIDALDCQRVFDRLYQVSIAADTGGASGLGLGLSIAREIVRGHGGELEVESAIDEGSTFAFTLPIAEFAATESAAAQGGAAESGASGSGATDRQDAPMTTGII